MHAQLTWRGQTQPSDPAATGLTASQQRAGNLLVELTGSGHSRKGGGGGAVGSSPRALGSAQWKVF